MKKLCFAFLALVIFCSLPLCTTAQSVAGTMNYEYSVDADSKYITVKLSLRDIIEETGITMVDYDIKYNSDVLRVESATANKPEKWESDFESKMAEDWSQLKEDGYYKWTVFNIEPQNAIFEYDELTFTIVFEVLDNVDSAVEFDCVYLANANIDKTYSNSAQLNVVFEGDKATVYLDKEELEMPSSSDENVSENESVSLESSSGNNSFVEDGNNSMIIIAIVAVALVGVASVAYVLFKK